MTVVEFYDKGAMDNSISSLALHPEKVIFLGDKKEIECAKTFYESLFSEFDCPTGIVTRSVPTNDLTAIINVLSEIAQTEDECVFDLTGGSDLVLTAMGIVYERYREKRNISMHRFDVKSGSAKDVVSGKKLTEYALPSLNVRQNVRIYGGRVAGTAEGGEIADWDFSGSFKDEMTTMWKRCRKNPGAWNFAVTALCDFLGKEQSKSLDLTVDIDIDTIPEDKKRDDEIPMLNSLLCDLQSDGLVTIHTISNHIAFTCVNEQVRRCLHAAGTLLEAMTYYAVSQMKQSNKNDVPVFHSSMNGVFIDWDGQFHQQKDQKHDTVNEIDVLAMRGLVPYFISCKNGKVESEELYKLNTVASRFGGAHAVKMLVCTYIHTDPDARQSLLERAKEMGIRVVCDVHEPYTKDFDLDRFAKTIRKECLS